jgi:hypothetical protein
MSQRTSAFRFLGTAALSLTLLALPLSACSDDATGPDGDGDESGQMSAAMQDSPSGSGSAVDVAFTHASMSGSMSADAKVQVSADGSTWVDLGSPKSTNMQLHTTGNTTTVHSNATVSTGTYAHVRLVLENASATVDAGSELGSTVLDASVNLTLGGSSGQVVVEKQIQPVTVSAESHNTVVFDLNSAAWITEENVGAQAVSEAEIRSATVVTVQ